eukprot:scaffold33164_cov59-Phaeocystis_antarctica.AAC.2
MCRQRSCATASRGSVRRASAAASEACGGVGSEAGSPFQSAQRSPSPLTSRTSYREQEHTILTARDGWLPR